MSLNVGLTSEKEFSCIVGFSGRIINMKDLSPRIKNKTDMAKKEKNYVTENPKSMMLVKSAFGQKKSFKLIPSYWNWEAI